MPSIALWQKDGNSDSLPYRRPDDDLFMIFRQRSHLCDYYHRRLLKVTTFLIYFGRNGSLNSLVFALNCNFRDFQRINRRRLLLDIIRGDSGGKPLNWPESCRTSSPRKKLNRCGSTRCIKGIITTRAAKERIVNGRCVANETYLHYA